MSVMVTEIDSLRSRETSSRQTTEDMMDELIEGYNASSLPVVRDAIRAAMLQLHVRDTIEQYGEFSSIDMDEFDECLAEGEAPFISRRSMRDKRLRGSLLGDAKSSLLSGDKGSLLSGDRNPTRLTDAIPVSPLHSGEVDGVVSTGFVSDTIKGSSQRSIQPHLPLLERSLSDSGMTPCDSNSHVSQIDSNSMIQSGVHSMIQDAKMIQDAGTVLLLPEVSNVVQGGTDSLLPVDALYDLCDGLVDVPRNEVEELLASYAARGVKVTDRFTLKSKANMARRFRALDLSPIIEDDSRYLLTAVFREEGMNELVSNDWLYGIRKQLFERWESAFGEAPVLLWKLEAIPLECTRMIGKVPADGYAHFHFYVRHPKRRSAHPRRSKFAAQFNGLELGAWFELTVRDIVGVVKPKRGMMTHCPKLDERGVYPEKYEDAVDQMVNYFRKGGQSAGMRSKAIQNNVPLAWLERGELHLKFWGDTGLKLRQGA